MISVTRSYTVMLLFFVLMSKMREMCSQFSRAKGYVKLYALMVFNHFYDTPVNHYLSLMGFKWGINGYLSGNYYNRRFIFPVFIFSQQGCIKNIKFKGLDKKNL